MGPLPISFMLLPGPVNLSWAPVQPPHAAGQVQSVSWVPVRPPIAAVSIATHSAMCHFQVSSHCWWFSIFVIGCC
ncbi:unnamed protein product, partial [Staurois parvus]